MDLPTPSGLPPAAITTIIRRFEHLTTLLGRITAEGFLSWIFICLIFRASGVVQLVHEAPSDHLPDNAVISTPRLSHLCVVGFSPGPNSEHARVQYFNCRAQ
jgi:hypothetical protein